MSINLFILGDSKDCVPAPPPLPDVNAIPGRTLVDLCPEESQHYKNRTAIMAEIPKEDKLSVGKAGQNV